MSPSPAQRAPAAPIPWDAVPRLDLAHAPTPITTSRRRPRGVELLIKRDDLTGSHLSGNKIRKLEYVLADAVARGATHVITCGGMNSNHCRATALAAAPLGLRTILMLRTAHGQPADLPAVARGNLLLDALAGAELRTCTPAEYRAWPSHLQALADEVRAGGGRPYVIAEGASSALGSLGYVRAAVELIEQLERRGQLPSSVAVATGSGGTLTGLALGIKARGLHRSVRVVGIPVCDDADSFRAIVRRVASEAAARFGLPALDEDDYQLLDGYQGRGYGLSTPEELALLRDVAREDGLVLDPTYTVKAFGATIECAGTPALPGPRVVFLHTGGIFGLSAAAAELVPRPGDASSPLSRGA